MTADLLVSLFFCARNQHAWRTFSADSAATSLHMPRLHNIALVRRRGQPRRQLAARNVSSSPYARDGLRFSLWERNFAVCRVEWSALRLGGATGLFATDGWSRTVSCTNTTHFTFYLLLNLDLKLFSFNQVFSEHWSDLPPAPLKLRPYKYTYINKYIYTYINSIIIII